MKIAVVAMGKIGLPLAVQFAEMGHDVVGVDVQQGVVDRCETELAAACQGAAVIQLAVPILAMEKLLGQLARLELGDAVLTDVGSAKGNVVRAARLAFDGKVARFVPGHPIAGSEQSGVEASNAELFRRHKVILTPQASTDAAALALIDGLWRALGADVEHMEVEHHDQVLAATSHLPHLLAFTLVDSLAKRSENLEIFRYAAGGFRDFTRIAGSDPVMWHDIFLANREAVLRTLDAFRDDLDALRGAVDAGDGHQLLGVFTRARHAREHFSKILARRAYVDAMNANDLIFLAQPGGRLSGRIRVPGDKSISHRSVMFSALGSTPVHITNFLHAQDCLSTAACMKALGASVEFESETALTVCGHGLHGLKEASTIIDAGNSGTTLRLMMGILAPQPFLTTFTGDASLHKRPMGRVIKPLSAMGAKIYGRENNTKLPITIVPAESRLHGMVYESPVASAQVKSAILLAGMYADGPTTVVEPFTSRDHTERMLEAFGVETKKEGTAVTIEPVDSFRAPEAIEVPGDILLPRLHEVIQAAMGWTDSHLHRFRTSNDRNPPEFLTQFDLDEGHEGMLEDDVRLDQLLSAEGDRLWYDYDFGDDWDHSIRIERVNEATPGVTKVFDSSQIPGEIIDLMVVNSATLKDNPELGKALTGAWYETMALMSGTDERAKAARTQMAKASGSDLVGYEAQLAATRMFYQAKDAVTFTNSAQLKSTMQQVAEFSFAHGLLGDSAPNAQMVGIETPSGIYGDSQNVKLRFDPSFMQLAADGKL